MPLPLPSPIQSLLPWGESTQTSPTSLLQAPGNTLHPTSGLIGKRNLQPRSFVTGNTSCTYRVRYPITVSATKIRMTFPNWSTVTAGTGDEPSGNTVTLSEVYVEYGGSLFPVTFRGATSYTMASGEAITSDEVSGLSVAAGTNLFIRTYVTCPVSGRWPGLYGAFTYPDEVSRPGLNLANATGDLTGTGQSVANLYGPLRVFGEISAGQPFYGITICGDSISAGTNDSFSNEGNVGYWQRALWPGTRPFSIVALPGENGTQLLSQGANRADIVGEYVDYVINQYGINDLQSGATLAQLQARSFANTVISRNPWVNGRYQQTLGPKSSSTDGWTTTTNQTTDGINTARVQFNDWVRDGMPEIGQVAVATGTVGAVRAGQGGHPYTGYIDVADLCESSRNSGIWKPNYTDDGLHPSVNGNLQIAAGLDLSIFVDTYPTTAPPAGASLAIATSPAMLSSGFQGSSNSQAFTSNTFSPPAGSVITVAAQATQSFNNTWNTPTITDSLGTHLTWTRVDTQADVSFSGVTCTASLFWAHCPSAQTNMTVTVTQSCTSGQTVTFSSIGVKIWTGADTTAPIGATAKGAVTSNALGVSLTPVGSGSALMILANNAAASSGASSAGTGEYLVDETHTGTSFCQAWYGSAVGPTIPATAQTLDLNGATARWQYIAFEVKSAPTPQTATVTFAGDSALSISATTTSGGQSASVSFDSTSTLTVTPLVTELATVTLASTSTLTVTPLVTHPATVALAQTSSLAITPLVTELPTVTMAGTSTLAVTGTDTIPATVTFASTSTLGVVVTGNQAASVSFDSTSTLAVTPLVTHPATVAMASTSTLTVAALDTIPAAVTMAGTSSLTITALVTHPSTIALVSASTLTVASSQTIQSAVTFAQTSALAITVQGQQAAAVAFVQASSMAVTAVVVRQAAIALAQASTVNIAAIVTQLPTLTFGQTSNVTIAGTVVALAAALMAQSSTFVVFLVPPVLFAYPKAGTAPRGPQATAGSSNRGPTARKGT